jgi:hypothetical protein
MAPWGETIIGFRTDNLGRRVCILDPRGYYIETDIGQIAYKGDKIKLMVDRKHFDGTRVYYIQNIDSTGLVTLVSDKITEYVSNMLIMDFRIK